MSRKQDHLEAGKRRLEEFRRKKAAVKVKKVTDGVDRFDGIGGLILDPPDAVTTTDNIKAELPQRSELISDYNTFSSCQVSTHVSDKESVRINTSSIETMSNQIAFNPKTISNMDGCPIRSSYYRIDELQSKEDDCLKNLSILDSSIIMQPNNPGYFGTPSSDDRSLLYEGSEYMHDNYESKGSMISDMRDRSLGSSVGNLPNGHNASFQASKSISTGLEIESKNSHNIEQQYFPISDTSPRRSRSSYLDSLNIPKASASLFTLANPEKPLPFMYNNSQVSSINVQTLFPPKLFLETLEPSSELKVLNDSALFEPSMNSSDLTINKVNQLRQGVSDHSMRMKHDLHSIKHNGDFATLEQHIEDLTQEKFSLQRAVEASRVLAESLAAENSDLTDRYNDQGVVVNQLRSDMETLQVKHKAQLVEHESIKAGYAIAQLQCNASDESAKLLASEVIGLEEKALKLRSSELNFGKQLEKSEAEIALYKKKMSSLEKERQDLQSTVEALQEEMKMLQSKLRKTSKSGLPLDASMSISEKKDVSTFTEDLVPWNSAEVSTSNLNFSSSTAFSSLSVQPEYGRSSLESFYVNIPSDHLTVIQNISTLMSELALEKEEFMRELDNESTCIFKLKELNNELCRKLEFQTQRLELLSAQVMASQNAPVREQNSQTMQENTAYADEGDEVVERVLGWIMKLFPGGPSKRRTSKLL